MPLGIARGGPHGPFRGGPPALPRMRPCGVTPPRRWTGHVLVGCPKAGSRSPGWRGWIVVCVWSEFQWYVVKAQRVRQGHQRHHVPSAGPHPLVPPAPHGLGIGVETAVRLRPRLLPETARADPGSRRVSRRLFCCGGCAVAASCRSFESKCAPFLSPAGTLRHPGLGTDPGRMLPAVVFPRRPGAFTSYRVSPFHGSSATTAPCSARALWSRAC